MFPLPRDGCIFYSDPNNGDDGAAGTLSSPFRTVHRAVNASRAAVRNTQGATGCTIVLRQGAFYFGYAGLGPIQLTPQDSGLSIQAYPGESVWLSGAVPFPSAVPWLPYNATGGNGTTGIWGANISGTGITKVPGMRQGYARLIRARYPNSNPEFGFGGSINPTWIAPDWAGPAVTFNPETPFRADAVEGTRYELGIGGGCNAYSPPAGFFCGNNSQRFFNNDTMPRWPKGMVAPQSLLPHTPYASNISGTAVVQAWRGGGWFTRMHVVGDYSPANGTFLFSGGGFQGHEGEDGGGGAYIENVLEELDYPGEWYYDQATGYLYLWPNGTAPGVYTLVQEQVLFNISGSQSSPVTNLSFLGLGFRDTAITYLEPHGLPSSGDWAMARTAALYAEGTVGLTVDGCWFDRLDGVNLMLSGYHRNATVQDSEFSWTGETAIALWGYTTGSPIQGMGPDTRNGDQPRGTTILRNIFRELGVWEKQSSAYFRAEAGVGLIEGNWVYNGPRAGLNFNDAALGGDIVKGNLVFNQCRESGDHGPINSWNRAAYWNDLRGYDSTVQLDDEVSGNLIIANYNSQTAVDNDDSSSHWYTHDNVFAYGPFGLKGDFGGHANRWEGNLVAYITGQGYWNTWGIQLAGEQNSFVNNTLVQTSDGAWDWNMACNVSGPVGWTYRQGYLPEGGDVLPPQTMSIDAAKTLCEATPTCASVTYQPGQPEPDGQVSAFFKSFNDPPFDNACCGTWTYNRTYGYTIVSGNAYYSPTGNIAECGMPLGQWQGLNPGVNDPGSVAGPYPDNAHLLALARTILGLPPQPSPASVP